MNKQSNNKSTKSCTIDNNVNNRTWKDDWNEGARFRDQAISNFMNQKHSNPILMLIQLIINFIGGFTIRVGNFLKKKPTENIFLYLIRLIFSYFVLVILVNIVMGWI